ncbi:MAG: alpha-hydroxy-acid oxidizing protein [Rhodospirillaceae bacterium]|nr:MAG: alpha-hydroxy-acid oxidizing protein [Rhodospirillaceae bacterium]
MTRAQSRAKKIGRVADAERMAKRRLPKAIFDGIASGAGQELTLRRNVEAFDEVQFWPRAAVLHPGYDLSTTVLGHKVSTPIMIAPTGSNRMFRREGEPALAKVAGELGAVYVTSCFTGYPIEEVMAHAKAPVFFDLYMVGGRSVIAAMLARAKQAGCHALVLTVDLAGTHGVERPGLQQGVPLGVNLATALQYAPQLITKLGWTLDFIRDGLQFDCPMWIKPDGRMASFGDVLLAFRSNAVCPTWDDLPWIRQHWDGPIVMKGILRTDDALRAANAGVDGIVVSNHGGRNVDGSPATLRVLPEIVDAVGNRLEVYFDGGIRRGTDVIKALALGAKAALIGRAYLYPFAAAGGAGVQRIYDIFHAHMLATLRSLGCPAVGELDRSYVTLPEKYQSPSASSTIPIKSVREDV